MQKQLDLFYERLINETNKHIMVDDITEVLGDILGNDTTYCNLNTEETENVESDIVSRWFDLESPFAFRKVKKIGCSKK